MSNVRIPCFEGWPRSIAHRNLFGYRVWAIQNKHDGHCIYDVRVKANEKRIYAYGKSEYEVFGKGSAEDWTKFYPDALEFMADWGLK